MKESIIIFIHTKQSTKQTQPEQPKQRHRRGFHYQQKIHALTTETTQRLEYSYLNFVINQLISYISSLTSFVHCTWLAEQFRTFHPSLHESATPRGYISFIPT